MFKPPPTSEYERQKTKWKQVEAATRTVASSRTTDREAAWMHELCSSRGTTSFPPRERLSRFLVSLKNVDLEVVSSLLEDKLRDRVWQVKAKALIVLDGILHSDYRDEMCAYMLPNLHLISKLKDDARSTIGQRASKVIEVLQEFQNSHPSHTAEAHNEETDQLHVIPQCEEGNERNLVEPADQHSSLPSECELPSTMASDAQASAAQDMDATVTSFSFLSTAVHLAEERPNSPSTTATARSAFDFLSVEANNFTPYPQSSPPSTDSRQLDALDLHSEDTSPKSEKVRYSKTENGKLLLQALQEPNSCAMAIDVKFVWLMKQAPIDRIAAAFEGLDMEASTNLFLAEQPEYGLILPEGEEQFLLLDVDVPPGPLGIVLDREIQDKAVIERFVPLPNGQKGNLQLHPGIKPGMILQRINGKDLQDLPLEEIGPILGSTFGMQRTLTFKRIIGARYIRHPTESFHQKEKQNANVDEENSQREEAKVGAVDDDDDYGERSLETSSAAMLPHALMKERLQAPQSSVSEISLLSSPSPAVVPFLQPTKSPRPASSHVPLESPQSSAFSFLTASPTIAPPKSFMISETARVNEGNQGPRTFIAAAACPETATEIESDATYQQMLLISDRLDTIDERMYDIQDLCSSRDATVASLQSAESELHQLYGEVDNIEMNSVDTVDIDRKSPHFKELKTHRSDLVARCEQLSEDLAETIGTVKSRLKVLHNDELAIQQRSGFSFLN